MPTMIKTVAAASAAVLLLSSCSGVGDGASPESLKILQITPDTVFNEDFIRADAVPGKAFTCVRGVLQAFIFFDDGDVGNFTRRVKWSSSDPSILTVSNFDEVVPGTPANRFDFGSIAPLAPGTVTVTATYLDMTATLPVTVTAAGALVLKPADKQIAPRSFQALTTSAVLGGRETNLTGQTVFDFNNGDPDAVREQAQFLPDDATVNGLAASAPIPVKAQLNVRGGACATNPDTMATAVVQVREIPERTTDSERRGLWLEPEPGYEVTAAGGTTLAEGTSQILRLIARFGDRNADGDSDDENESQELSFQAGAVGTYTSSDQTAATFIGASLLGRGSLVYGIPDVETSPAVPADGLTDLSAVYGAQASATPPVAGTTSNLLPLRVRDVLLKSIAITSSNERVATDGLCTVADTFGAVPASVTGGRFLCLKATGTFGPASGSGPDDYTQDISKDVAWTSTVPSVLGVANGRVIGAGVASTTATAPATGGTAACQGQPNCNVKVTAAFATNKLDATGRATVISAETPIIQVVFPTEDTTP